MDRILGVLNVEPLRGVFGFWEKDKLEDDGDF